jgi:hypothetical protein
VPAGSGGKADRVEEMVLDAVRGYSVTADVHGRASRRQQIREADEAIERASADLDDTIRQLGELGLLGRPASRETLGKLTKTLDDAHTVRARLGDRGESDVIGPDEIDKLRELPNLALQPTRGRVLGFKAPPSTLGGLPHRRALIQALDLLLPHVGVKLDRHGQPSAASFCRQRSALSV